MYIINCYTQRANLLLIVHYYQEQQYYERSDCTVLSVVYSIIHQCIADALSPHPFVYIKFLNTCTVSKWSKQSPQQLNNCTVFILQCVNYIDYRLKPLSVSVIN